MFLAELPRPLVVELLQESRAYRYIQQPHPCVSFCPVKKKMDKRHLHAAPGDRTSAGRRALRILVADDERDTVITSMTLLRADGYEVRGVYDGPQVLDAAEEFRPDVVLLDIGMPKIDGYELARILRARYGDRHPVLIAITAYSKQTDKMLAQLAGFDHHFGKPIAYETLNAVLRGIVPAVQ